MELATIKSNPFVLALQSEKIIEMKKGEACKVFIDLLSKTYFDAGQVTPGYDVKQQSLFLQTLSNALHEEIKDCFPFLRIEEIKLAFKNGLRGEYGEYFGINIKTFHQWVKAWQFDEKRKAALESIRKAKEVEYTPVMSESEAEYEYKQTLQRQFKTYKETGAFAAFMPARLFLDLEGRGLIKLSADRKREIYRDAEAKYKEGCKRVRLNPKNKIQLNEMTAAINRIENGMISDTDKVKIKSVACELAVKEYYDSISELKL